MGREDEGKNPKAEGQWQERKLRAAKVAREKPEHVGRVATLHRGVEKEATTNVYAIEEDDSETVEEASDDEEDVLAWSVLEESENEQWQEVISRRDKQKVKKANQAALLSVENSHNSNTQKIIEVLDRWVNVRVTMDSGAAGHVMPGAMFPRVKLANAKHRQRSLWQRNGEQI